MAAQELLARAAEELSAVVDPTARARLMEEYLTLLKHWHNVRGRVDASYVGRVRSLYNRTRMARGNYRLWPGLGLGPLDARFWNAYNQAGGVFKRLESLAGRTSDPAVREMRRRELRDLKEQVEKLRDEVERVATISANLSRMETLASQLNNVIAVHLLSRERQWAAELRQRVPVYAPRGVTSGVLSMVTRPDIWNRRASGLSAWYEDYGAAVTQAWKDRRSQVLKASQAGWRTWQSCVRRLATVKRQIDRAARVPRLAEAAANVEQRRSSMVALARSIAADLKQVVGWSDPMRFWEMHLAGEAEQSAGILLQADQVKALAAGTAEVERAAAALR